MRHLSDKNMKIIEDSVRNIIEALGDDTNRPGLVETPHRVAKMYDEIYEGMRYTNDEIAEMFNVTISSTEDLLHYGNQLKEMGAQNVLISMGGDGAILISETGEIYRSNVPKGTVKNSVGAGDSMVAGFIAGYQKHHSYEEALRLGAASGSATAFSSDVATREYIDELVSEINVTKL